MSFAPGASGAHYAPVSPYDDPALAEPSHGWADAAAHGSPAHLGASTATLPVLDDEFEAPHPRFMGAGAGGTHGLGDPSLRESYASGSQTPGFSPAGSMADLHEPGYRDSPTPGPGGFRDAAGPSGLKAEYGAGSYGAGYGAAPYTEKARSRAPRSRRRLFIGAGAALLVLVIVGVVLGVVLSSKSSSSGSSGSGSGTAAGDAGASGTAAPGAAPTAGSKAIVAAVTGKDGSTVTMDDGSTFKYSNPYGGWWYFDENDVFNNGAKCNSWTPALNETFKFGDDRIFGVNLGGWLNTEPFITPALYEKYVNGTPSTIDEYTLSQAMRADTGPGGGISQLEDHYKTFITEQDFAQIAAAGLNFVRIPLPYWAIEVRGNEPFLAGTAWKYFLKAIQWARKYGIRINLDFHAMPGSQNGWNHSSKQGTVNWLYGPMGYANAQRSLDYIRIIAEFIAQPQYRDVVAMYGVVNEPSGSGSTNIGQENMERFYLQAYNIVRNATGAGQGPWISYHEAFFGVSQWAGFLPGADRISLDTHPYMAFVNQPTGAMDDAMAAAVNSPCSGNWGSMMNTSMDAFGLTAAGEFSLAITDCAKWLPGVNMGYRYEGTFPGFSTKIGSCDQWTHWEQWDDAFKKSMLGFALASMDALQNWFFWTWKIGNSTDGNRILSPAWSYQLGLQQGWIPKDPRTAAGTCKNNNPRASSGLPSASGIPASATQSIAWPPTTIGGGGPLTNLPAYTPTGALVTLAGATFAPTSGQPAPTATPSAGSGWMNAADNAGMAVSASGCSYYDPWIGPTDPPSPLCAGPTPAAAATGGGSRRRARVTPAPRAH